jgi:hypothetical protein
MPPSRIPIVKRDLRQFHPLSLGGARKGQMPLRLEGRQMGITPRLLEWIAERLEALNT